MEPYSCSTRVIATAIGWMWPRIQGFHFHQHDPAQDQAAPAAARPERPSPTKKYDVIQAITGSSM